MKSTFLIIVALVYIGVLRFIKRRININIQEINGLYKHVNQIHRQLEILLSVLLIVIFCIIGFVYPKRLEPHNILVLLTVLSSFRSFMEWKFNKQSKQYILYILNSSVFLLVFIGFELFFN